MQFIYVGRLDPEKGIQSLLFCIEKLIKNEITFHIDIYGAGAYTKQVQKLSIQHPYSIKYHGRKNKKEIIGPRSGSDFFIMPSTFLETFGLTACESLLSGVPVIGNKKGGLLPFIHDDLDIQHYPGQHDGEKLYNLIHQLIEKKVKKLDFSSLIEQTKKIYTKEQWIKKIEQIIPHNKKIIIINDFINYNGGGIETHIHDASQILKENGYTTLLYGHEAPSGNFLRIKKLTILSLSLCNIQDGIKINHIIKKEKNGFVWWHNISRAIGRLGLRSISGKKTPQIITHHELGLFHPFPSKITDASQLPKARSFGSFLKAGKTKNIITMITIFGRYMLVRLIHKQLQKKVKIHIVPSAWMIPMVKSWHPHSTVIEVGHFVDVE